MADLLIPLGLLAFIALFAYALVSGARRQQAKKQAVFRDFAHQQGLEYRAEDDGAARRFAAELDGIGRFESPSLGAVHPRDVVSGTFGGRRMILFRHGTRFGEGNAREWFVAGTESAASIAERGAVQISKRPPPSDSLYLEDPVVHARRIGSVHVQVRAPSSDAAAKLIDDTLLTRLAGHAAELPFEPEIQIRANRIAVYPGNRNDGIETVDELRKLAEYAIRIADGGPDG